MHSLYQQQIMDHYHFPRHKGVLKAAGDCVQSACSNPSCGDKVMLSLCIERGVVRDALFDGVGCILSLAAADMLLDKIIGTSCEEINAIGVEDIKKMVGIDVGPMRIKCILLPLEALQEIMHHA